MIKFKLAEEADMIHLQPEVIEAQQGREKILYHSVDDDAAEWPLKWQQFFHIMHSRKHKKLLGLNHNTNLVTTQELHVILLSLQVFCIFEWAYVLTLF